MRHGTQRTVIGAFHVKSFQGVTGNLGVVDVVPSKAASGTCAPGVTAPSSSSVTCVPEDHAARCAKLGVRDEGPLRLVVLAAGSMVCGCVRSLFIYTIGG